MNYEVVPYEGVHEDGVIRLQRELWGRSLRRNRRYFDWKYRRNPHLDDFLIALALHEGEVIGMRGLFGARWEAGTPTTPFDAPCTGDLVIDPRHRQKGLLAAMSKRVLKDAAARGYEWAFNLSAGRVTQIAHLALGWRKVTVPSMLRSGRQSRWPLPAPVTSFDRAKTRAEDPSAIVTSREPRPAEMAALVHRLGHEGRIRHVRGESYFAWRYQQPLAQHRFLYWEESRLAGYLVLRFALDPRQRRVVVLDWEAESDEARFRLLDAVLRRSDFQSLTVWSASLPESTRRELYARGFEDRKPPTNIMESRPSIMAVPLRPEATAEPWQVAGRPLLDLESWDLRMSYSDKF